MFGILTTLAPSERRSPLAGIDLQVLRRLAPCVGSVVLTRGCLEVGCSLRARAGVLPTQHAAKVQQSRELTYFKPISRQGRARREKTTSSLSAISGDRERQADRPAPPPRTEAGGEPPAPSSSIRRQARCRHSPSRPPSCCASSPPCRRPARCSGSTSRTAPRWPCSCCASPSTSPHRPSG